MTNQLDLKYDFEKIVDRKNVGSYKWDQMKGWNPNVSENVIPFSVADMELKNPPEIIEGLKNFIDSNILGYTGPTPKYYDSVCRWMKKRHNWEIDQNWIVNTPGVVTAFFEGIKAFSEPGDGVIIMPPVYYPFYNAIELNDRKIVRNSLLDTGKSYKIDFDDLESKAKKSENKILLFCSPHNPTGRVWTEDELKRIGKICLENDIFIISDEIHNDLIMPGYEHTVFATLSEKLANNMIVCTAPSKTFNIAGLQNSNIIIPNNEIRKKYKKQLEKDSIELVNMIGLKACELAYNKSEEWLEELIDLIDYNQSKMQEYIKKNIPQIKVYELEGTYLQWLDFRNLEMTDEELEKLMHKDAELFFDEGYIFGEEGSGFERWNIACPTSYIMDGLERLKETIDSL
jgi:aminotransferase/cystathionine beta-lyase